MTSFDSYEQNLERRLEELRRGDRAYELNGDAILETLPYEPTDSPEVDTVRILDVGCGLGFVAVKLASWPCSEVVGIDPSKRAIEIAKSEHGDIGNLRFYAESAEDFANKRENLAEPLFSRAVLNMVLHSVDDAEVLNILEGIKKCLLPHGALSMIVPDEVWLVQKLVEKAHKAGMSWEEMDPWGRELMSRKSVDLAVGIHGEKTYDHPITIYNRTLKDYSALLKEAGYGLDITVSSPNTPENKTVIKTGFWEWDDHLSGSDLAHHDRHVLLTQVR
ncbi:MAG TPA: class I SAM-dependent methyltransferase [Candidatus Microsaccharimonas sp.]|jgi:SAM-dependent methyltransferase